jgi:hypothetical protein
MEETLRLRTVNVTRCITLFLSNSNGKSRVLCLTGKRDSMYDSFYTCLQLGTASPSVFENTVLTEWNDKNYA